MAKLVRWLAAAVLASGSCRLPGRDGAAAHGIAMHGEPEYPPDFTHFDYVNPDAPKGGSLVMAAIGTFDSLNPYIVRARRGGRRLTFETLTTQSNDEAFTEYGLLAETIEMPEDRSWVAFELRPEARWHDGKPVTVDDVIFSFDMLKTQGRALLPRLLRQRRQGGGRTASAGEVRVRRHHQPRAAADHRPAAGAAEALLGGPGLRADDARAAAGQRPLPGQERRCRPLHHLWSACRTIGARTSR